MLNTLIKGIKYLLIGIVSIIGLILLFVLVSIIPLDRTPYKDRPSYTEMQRVLQTLDTFSIPQPVHHFYSGFSKENITPPFVTSIAGVGLRKLKYTAVHDSIYARCIVIDNGTHPIALVSLDMLIFPPKLRDALEVKLPSVGFTLENTYLSVTHTHSSIGNWGEHLVGELYTGPYEEKLIDFLSDRIILGIKKANGDKQSSEIKIGSVAVPDLLFNRLADEAGTIDSILHIIEIKREDSTSLLLTSFTGHATCATGSNTELSRDYPGVLVDQLEASGYTFAMFMAGAVGSHGCKRGDSGWEKVNSVGLYVAERLLNHKDKLKTVSDSALAMIRIPLSLDEPQLKISKDWRVRPWLYRALLGEYPSYLTGLRIGNQIMLGTPCDFSGELTSPFYEKASSRGFEVMVTSFNGSYVGYITRDEFYDRDHYETRLMNWYGPGNGAYFSGNMMHLMDVLTK